MTRQLRVTRRLRKTINMKEKDQNKQMELTPEEREIIKGIEENVKQIYCDSYRQRAWPVLFYQIRIFYNFPFYPLKRKLSNWAKIY